MKRRRKGGEMETEMKFFSFWRACDREKFEFLLSFSSLSLSSLAPLFRSCFFFKHTQRHYIQSEKERINSTNIARADFKGEKKGCAFLSFSLLSLLKKHLLLLPRRRRRQRPLLLPLSPRRCSPSSAGSQRAGRSRRRCSPGRSRPLPWARRSSEGPAAGTRKGARRRRCPPRARSGRGRFPSRSRRDRRCRYA